MPFLTFALPVLRPRHLHVLVVLLAMFSAQAMAGTLGWDALASGGLEKGHLWQEPWRVLTYSLVQGSWFLAVGNAAGLVVGLTMATRAVGARWAWLGLVLGVLLGAAYMAWSLPTGAVVRGASCAVYTVLGMGTMAWMRMRDEITYPHRADIVAGLGTIGLVLFALLAPVVLDGALGQQSLSSAEEWARFLTRHAHPMHLLGLFAGAAVIGVSPRHW
jgi:membrane associated rhomboid family serine protease